MTTGLSSHRGDGTRPRTRVEWGRDGERRRWARRRDSRRPCAGWRSSTKGFVEDQAGLGLGLAGTSALDAKTAALLQVGVSVAIGSSAVCLEWSAARALAAGATKDEIADVLLAIAPVAGLGRVVSAAPGVATALDMTSTPRWRNLTSASWVAHDNKGWRPMPFTRPGSLQA